MNATEQTAQRLLRWRIEGLAARIGQATLVALLGAVATGATLIPVWFAVTLLLTVLDTWLSRSLLERPEDRRLAAFTTTGRVASSIAFALLMPLLAISPSHWSVTCAILVGCATVLNNAIMS